MSMPPHPRGDNAVMSAQQCAVVLINVGSPDEPTSAAVRVYLRNFLSDRRVVETSPWLWRPILEGIVLRTRPSRSAEKYRSVWLDEGSPLTVIADGQAQGLAERLDSNVMVRAAMCYGTPRLTEVLDEIATAGISRVLAVPMYPQYAGPTTAAALDAVYRDALSRRNHFELRTVRSFGTNETYIEAMARSIEESWRTHGRPNFDAGEKLLFSFHSIPQSYAADGDPYPHECAQTADALRRRLGVTVASSPLTYQSKFGRSPWLEPTTVGTVEQLARDGARRVDVYCPGFVADCLETLEEIDVLNRRVFLNAGGEELVRAPCLNEDSLWLDALAEVTRVGLCGWVD